MTKLHATLLLACILSAPCAYAQSPQLKLVVILSRHGVRSPTWTQDRLDAVSVKPWPTWTVPPGDLTSHGFDLLKSFGIYDRATLSSSGLFAPTGCAGSAATFVYADTDQRTLASGHALAEGLFPNCPPQVHSAPSGATDPIFHAPNTASPTQSAAALAELQQRLPLPAGSPVPALLAQLQNILLDCAPTASACTPSHPPATLLPTTPITAVRGKGDHLVDLTGPLPTASTLSEDLLLEYTDGMSPANVGWGHLTETQLRPLLALHTVYFDLLHRTPALARLGNGGLLRNIALTLQQAIDGHPLDGAIGPPDARLVVLVGHDTNLASIAALLGLHWTLDGRSDDTPPGTELAFQLWQTAPATAAHAATYAVRTVVTQQTLFQMHTLTPTGTTSTPPSTSITPTGCPTYAACPWPTFQHLIDAATAR